MSPEPAPKRTYDLFISYESDNRDFAQLLAERLLEARGWSLWWDRELEPGSQYPQQIQAALNAARCVIVLWTKDAIDSRWVIAEASEGWNRQVLVPVLREDCDPPMPFRQTQAANLSQWSGDPSDHQFLALLQSIERVLQQQTPASHEELLEREQRLRTFTRKRWLRRMSMVASAIAVLATIAIGYAYFSARSTANQIAKVAQTQLNELQTTLNESSQIWFASLVDNTANYGDLELATLLAIEAYSHAATPESEAALRHALALSPVADHSMPIDHPVGALAFSADNQYVVAAGGQDNTFIWDFANNQITARITGGGLGGNKSWRDRRSDRIDTLARGPLVLSVSTSAPIIATAGPGSQVELWGIPQGEPIARLDLDDQATAVVFDPKGKNLATLSEQGTITLWSPPNWQQQWRYKQGGNSYWLQFSSSGRYLMSVADTTKGHQLTLVDANSGTEAHRFQVAGLAIESALSLDDHRLAIFGYDSDKTDIFEQQVGKGWLPVNSSPSASGITYLHANRYVRIGLDTPDNRFPDRLAASVGLWPIDATNPIWSHSLDQYPHSLSRSESASPNLLVVSGTDVRVWDVNGNLLRVMPYVFRATTPRLSRDGRLLVSSGADSSGRELLEVTELVPDDLITAACGRLSRQLTIQEWRTHLDGREYAPSCSPPPNPEGG